MIVKLCSVLIANNEWQVIKSVIEFADTLRAQQRDPKKFWDINEGRLTIGSICGRQKIWIHFAVKALYASNCQIKHLIKDFDCMVRADEETQLRGAESPNACLGIKFVILFQSFSLSVFHRSDDYR